MADDNLQPEPLTVTQFLTAAGLFEGGLLLLAFGLGWLCGVYPTSELSWSLTDFGMGLVATIPMLMLFAACWLSRSNGMRQIRFFLRDSIGPLLNQCRGIDILFLALLAGICEEVLFRGFLFQWIRPFNLTLAILITNLIFGITHSITPLYAFLAGLMGLYLTALMTVDSTPNLLVPLTAHAAYDYVAFVFVLRDYRQHQELLNSSSENT